MLTTFRTISQLLSIWVLPDIDRRLGDGSIQKTELPIEVNRFQILQPRNGNRVHNIVELNQEVEIIAQVKLKRTVSQGQRMTLADIYPDECFIAPPERGGNRCAYILCESSGFGYTMFLDLEPNVPGITDKELSQLGVRYPILEFVNARNFMEVVKPYTQLNLLADKNWPPAPGYYPRTLRYLHENPDAIDNESFVDEVADSYNSEYWDARLAFWEDTNFFPNRHQYIAKAVEEHFAKDFISSIYVIVPQFEGIIKDYLCQENIRPPSRFDDCVAKLKSLVLSRKLLLFPKQLLDTTFDFLETGSFWRHSKSIRTPSDQVNRHGILHGDFTNFEGQLLSLKFLILLDALSFVLLHDKMLSGKL